MIILLSFVVVVKLRILGNNCNTIGTIALLLLGTLSKSIAWAILLISKSGAILLHYYFAQPWFAQEEEDNKCSRVN